MASTNQVDYAGAMLLPDGSCRFRVFAPEKKRLQLYLPDRKLKRDLEKDNAGFFSCVLSDVAAGTKYFFIPDDDDPLPDPASHFQPEGVHGPSMVVDHNAFAWTDENWKGLSFSDLILYEMHVGTFTTQGTFETAITRLDDLKALGVNAIELMPVSQFPGTRNWGYDGVFPYAVQNSYGGPDKLKMLVNACHEKGVAVFLDVVYNHIGPEGNYLNRYAPYFTDNYGTPWGEAINFDGNWSDGVREYFSENALHWYQHYHLDGLRLDAIHMVFDNRAIHFWQETSQKIQALQKTLGRQLHTIAESDLNSTRVIADTAHFGFGFTAQWLDDFHHALYVVLDPEGKDRYVDFGLMEQVAKAYAQGFVHSGDFVKFRKRKHGMSSAHVPGDRFVVFKQNHDQVGNRPLGERLSMLIDFRRLKVSAAALMLSPYVPMLFMGEEYGETTPFYYFVSHSDADLIDAVRKGRKEEFKNFPGADKMPDPQDEKTFLACRLDWEKRLSGKHRTILEWHSKLISMRKEVPALGNFNKDRIQAYAIGQSGLVVQRQTEDSKDYVICIFNFSDKPIECAMPSYCAEWKKILDSLDSEWGEKRKPSGGSPLEAKENETIPVLPTSVVVYEGTGKDA